MARGLKRLLDLLGAILLLLLSAPLLLLAMGCVVLVDGWPAIFVQERVGQGGRIFRLFKLRTMQRNTLPVSAVGQVHGDHPMVLRTGRWWRRLKVDELPQLVNVLRGDMSMVGPRPTVAEQVAAYSAYQYRRLGVRPGLTGWAQVRGGVMLSWPERMLLDVWYVDHWSLGLDLRILLATFPVLFRGERSDPRALELARRHEVGSSGT